MSQSIDYSNPYSVGGFGDIMIKELCEKSNQTHVDPPYVVIGEDDTLFDLDVSVSPQTFKKIKRNISGILHTRVNVTILTGIKKTVQGDTVQWRILLDYSKNLLGTDFKLQFWFRLREKVKANPNLWIVDINHQDKSEYFVARIGEEFSNIARPNVDLIGFGEPFKMNLPPNPVGIVGVNVKTLVASTENEKVNLYLGDKNLAKKAMQSSGIQRSINEARKMGLKLKVEVDPNKPYWGSSQKQKE